MKTAIALVFALAVSPVFAQDPAKPQDATKPLPPGGEGKPAAMADSPLKPHPAKLTETPESEIPIKNLKLPAGFKAEIWASGMPGVRMLARGDKGTVWGGTRVIGRVYEIKDQGGKRTSRILADKLVQPNGLVFKDGALWVITADSKVLRYEGIEDKPDTKPVDLSDKFNIPKTNHHHWKFIAFGPDGKLYVPIGAPCNICEAKEDDSQIRRYNADGSGMEIVAKGVRNTVGFDWHPKTKELWFTDNGRDWMGEEGPADELNRVSKPGQNFGYPYCHAQGVPDRDLKKPKEEACKGVTLPVALLGPHAGALGMRFYQGDMFPAAYKDSMFIARRGSWNRTKLFAFDVVNVRTGADGKSAKVTPFLTGFRDDKENKFWGRPVDVMVMPDGALLVSDEQNGAIYRISYDKAAAGKGKAKK